MVACVFMSVSKRSIIAPIVMSNGLHTDMCVDMRAVMCMAHRHAHADMRKDMCTDMSVGCTVTVHSLYSSCTVGGTVTVQSVWRLYSQCRQMTDSVQSL